MPNERHHEKENYSFNLVDLKKARSFDDQKGIFQ